MDGRLERAREVLDRAGVSAPVRADGFAADIAAVTGPPSLKEPLARLAPELRSLGFRYVALELEHHGKIPPHDP
jgi:hypothetical protein